MVVEVKPERKREVGHGADARRIRFVGFTMALLMGLDIVSSQLSLGWKSITFNTALILALDGLYILRYRDGQLARWFLFGLAAGWVELLIDRWFVGTGTLVYPVEEPHIWASPAYMPFAWAMVLVQLGVVGAWLRQRLSFFLATVLTAVISGINIPIYEHLAKGAKWWWYQQTPMLFDAPYYVICAEFLLALPLVWMAGKMTQGPLSRSAVLGVAEGVWILIVGGFAFWLLGPCTGSVFDFCR